MALYISLTFWMWDYITKQWSLIFHFSTCTAIAKFNTYLYILHILLWLRATLTKWVEEHKWTTMSCMSYPTMPISTKTESVHLIYRTEGRGQDTPTTGHSCSSMMPILMNDHQKPTGMFTNNATKTSQPWQPQSAYTGVNTISQPTSYVGGAINTVTNLSHTVNISDHSTWVIRVETAMEGHG